MLSSRTDTPCYAALVALWKRTRGRSPKLRRAPTPPRPEPNAIASSVLFANRLDLEDECACSFQVMVETPLQEAWCLGQGNDTDASLPPAREATILRTWEEYVELARIASPWCSPAGEACWTDVRKALLASHPDKKGKDPAAFAEALRALRKHRRDL